MSDKKQYEKFIEEEYLTKSDIEDEMIRYKKIAQKIKWHRLKIAFGIAVILILVLVVSGSMYQRAIVSGQCMEPTILNNEEYILNKWSYKFSAPKRNDIIIYESEGIFYITRIIGLPKETVEMKNGKIYRWSPIKKSKRLFERI